MGFLNLHGTAEVILYFVVRFESVRGKLKMFINIIIYNILWCGLRLTFNIHCSEIVISMRNKPQNGI